MTNYDPSPTESEQRPSRSWLLHSLAWPLLIAAGFLIYELTALPGLGVPVACAKFGWEDFLTARWLRRVDPHRGRGRTHFWLYLASSLWKIAITATIIMFAIVIVEDSLKNRQQAQQAAGGGKPPPDEFMHAGLVALIGFGLSSTFTFAGCWSAWRHGIKIWLDSALHKARRINSWPPRRFTRNGAGRLLFTTLLLTLFAVFVTAMFVGLAELLDPKNVPRRRAGADLGVLALFGFMFGGPVVILIARDFIKRRLIAQMPSECWGVEPPIEMAGLTEETDFPLNPPS